VTALAIAATTAAAASACDRRPPPLASCDDDLRGVYVAGGRRWMILDARDTLEGYPLFDDVAPTAPPPGLEVAPRLLALSRTPGPGGAISGDVVRRYMSGPRVCLAKVPARITACAGDAIDIVLSDPAPPLAFDRADPAKGRSHDVRAPGEVTGARPCLWPRPGASRRERWVRE
jgi:hypothetical protein